MEKRNNIIYWIATVLLSAGMLGSGIQQLMDTQAMKDLIKPLGYPDYLLYILGVWKILAIIAILAPGFKLLKEWAYAGLFFAMTGAFVSHLAVSDYGFKSLASPVFQTLFIILSWHFRPANRKIIYS